MKREGMAGVVDFVKGQDIYKGKGGFNIRIASFIRPRSPSRPRQANPFPKPFDYMI